MPLASVVLLAGVAPFINALWTSFHAVQAAWDGAGTLSYVGLDNYRILLADRGFPMAAGITVSWALLSAAVTMVLAYLLAALLHGSRRAYHITFPVLVAAWATPVYIGAPLWRFILHGAAGDSLFRTLTGITVNLMASPVAAFVSSALVAAWFRLPQAVFILLAAFSRSRRDLDDAAAIDGAGPAALTFSIRLPAMAGALGAVTALELVSAFKEFTVPFLLTAGGPPLRAGVTDRTVVGATTTLEIYLYDLFSGYADAGVVSAYAVVLSVAVCAVVLAGMSLRSALKQVSPAMHAEAVDQARKRNPGDKPDWSRTATSWPDEASQPNQRNQRNQRQQRLRWIPGRLADTMLIGASWLTVGVLVAAGLALLWCLLWMAFSDLAVAFVDSFLPRFPTAANFGRTFVDDGLGLALMNTLYVSAISALLIGVIAFPAATWLAERSVAKAALVFVALQALSSTGGVHSLIPLYDLWRRLGILGGYAPIILVYLYHSAPVALFALTAFLHNQPRSFTEAARLEGLSGLGYILRIQLPLALPAIGASAMIAFLSAWNGFLAPLVFLDDDARYTIAVRLHAYVGSIASGAPKWNRFAAAAIVNIAIIGVLFWRFKRPLTRTALADHNED